MSIESMHVERNEDIAWSELDDEIVLLDIEEGDFYTLNQVAAEIWRFIDGKSTIGDIIGRIMTLYDADEAQVRDDVIRVIGSFTDRNLVSLSHESRS
jgi:hypothetical protein